MLANNVQDMNKNEELFEGCWITLYHIIHICSCYCAQLMCAVISSPEPWCCWHKVVAWPASRSLHHWSPPWWRSRSLGCKGYCPMRSAGCAGALECQGSLWTNRRTERKRESGQRVERVFWTTQSHIKMCHSYVSPQCKRPTLLGLPFFVALRSCHDRMGDISFILNGKCNSIKQFQHENAFW